MHQTNNSRDSLAEMKQMLHRYHEVLDVAIQRTASLRKSYPTVKVPDPILSIDDRQSVYSRDPSISGDSTTEFDFDAEVFNSQSYRQALKSARATSSQLSSEHFVLRF